MLIVKRILIISLFVLLLPLHILALQINNELLLPGYGETDAHYPAFAMGDSVGLVVWQSGINQRSGIVGIRIDKQGQPLDMAPFVISDAIEAQEEPRVAYGNGLFVVAWNDLRSGIDYDVYAARVTAAGVVLDQDGIAIAEGERNQCDPAVCRHGSGFYLVWRKFIKDNSLHNGKYALFSRMLSTEGMLTSIDSIPFVRVGSAQEVSAAEPVLSAIDANTAALIFPSVSLASLPTRTNSIRKIQNGVVTESNVFANGLRQGPDIAIADNGSNIVAVWSNYYNAGGRGSVASAGMAKMAISSFASAAVSNPYPSTEWGQKTKIAWDGYNFITVWQRKSGASNTTQHANLKIRLFTNEAIAADTAISFAGNFESPAAHPVIGSDGQGNSFIIYERHPVTSDVPIKIAVTVIVNQPVAVEAALPLALKEGIFCSPNPFFGKLDIVLVSGQKNINKTAASINADVFSLQGVKVATLKPQHFSVEANAAKVHYGWNSEALPNGIYSVRIKEGGRLWHGKVVLAK